MELKSKEVICYMTREEGKAKIIEKKLIRRRIGLIYPEITDLENQEAQRMINEKIQEEIYKMIIEQGYEEDYTKQFWGEYKVALNEKDLLSILIYIHSYSKEAAHGLTALNAMSFDLLNGKPYELADLFTKSSDYVDRINAFVREEIIEKQIPLLVDFETIDKRQDYYLTKDALIIFFQVYEYTPYAYGIPEFRIPYYALMDIIDESGPLGFLKR